MKICTTETCGKPVRAKGLCRSHYLKLFWSYPQNASRYRDVAKKSYDKARASGSYGRSRRTFLYRFKTARRAATARKIPWDLTVEQFTQLINLATCHYCSTTTMPETGSGLDRKDNSLGYTLTNVVPCCFTCNKIKSDCLTYEEMLMISVALKNYRMCLK